MNAPTFTLLPNVRKKAMLMAVAASTLLILAGCSRKQEKVEEIRPVRVVTVTSERADVLAEFPGEVRARYESRLGFRVGGKIIARKVDVGTVVKRGQLLMQLDPQDLQLAQRQAEAGLRSAQSNRDLAAADLQRYRDLRRQNFVSQAALDAKVTSYDSAQASVEQAQASLRNQSNQAGYASLVADVDGVVTSIDAEAGQVVTAGTPVVGVARSGEKDVVIGVPEDRVDALRRVQDVRVRLWADPKASLAGKVREVAPVADAATRTYAVKVALPEAGENVRLGMTAYAAFLRQSAEPVIRLPLSALSAAHAGGSTVWLVENGAVRKSAVQVVTLSGNEVVVNGLTPGQTVVTAGVNLLQQGQKVKILGQEETAAARPGADIQAAAGAAQ